MSYSDLEMGAAKAYSLLERWLALFEAAGVPVMSGDPANHPILSVMGETRKLLRERPANG